MVFDGSVQIAPVLCSYLTITVLNHCSIAAVLFTKYWGLAGKGTKSKPAKLKVSYLSMNKILFVIKNKGYTQQVV